MRFERLQKTVSLRFAFILLIISLQFQFVMISGLAQAKRPYTKKELLITLNDCKNHPRNRPKPCLLTAAAYIEEIKQFKVDFIPEPGSSDEEEVKEAGSFLGEKGLSDLLKALRAYYFLPRKVTITSISPISGVLNGEYSAEITGSGYTSQTKVFFGGVEAVVSKREGASKITVKVPPSSVSKTVDIALSDSSLGDYLLSFPDQFTYTYEKLKLASVTPTEGATRGGTILTLKGKGFVTGSTVGFLSESDPTGGSGFPAASVTFKDGETLEITTPSHKTGLVSIIVTNPDTQTSSLDYFTFIPPLQISSKRLLDSLPGENVELSYTVLGHAVAYKAEQNNKFLFIANGKKSLPFNAVDLAVFSPDGSKLAFRARRSDLLENKYSIVVGDEIGGTFDEVTQPIFSPNGTKVAYTAKKDDKWFIVTKEIGSKEITYGGYPSVVGPLFRSDGSTIVYAAREPRKPGWRLFDGTKETLLKDVENIKDLLLSPDGTKLIYVASRVSSSVQKRKIYMDSLIVNGISGPKFLSISFPVVSLDGQIISYVVENNSVVIFQDKSEKDYKYVQYRDIRVPPVFSPDGSKLAYIFGSEGSSSIVVNTKRIGPLGSVKNAVFSSDSSSFAYNFYTDWSWHMGMNGQTISESFDEMTAPVFIPNSNKIAFAGAKIKNKWRIFVGDEVSAEFNWVSDPILSQEKDKIEFIVLRGRELWLYAIDVK